MNKKLLVFIVSFLIIAEMYARKVEGIIVFNNDSVAHVTFNIPVSLFKEINVPSIQHGIDYYSASGETIKLKPDSAKEIRFKFEYENFRMISCVNNFKNSRSVFSSNKKIFLKLEIDGKLRLYKYYFVGSQAPRFNAGGGMMAAGSTYTVESFVLQKDNGELHVPSWLRFKKDMKAYLSDCPRVVAKIEEGKYMKELIQMMVRDYNACRNY